MTVIDDQVMALKGTAIQAAILTNTLNKDITVIDITAMSVVLEQSNGSFVKLISSNTIIPNVAPKIVINKKNVEQLTFLQGANQLNVLGVLNSVDFFLDLDENQYELEVSVDRNGIISIRLINTINSTENLIFLGDNELENLTLFSEFDEEKEKYFNKVPGKYFANVHEVINDAFDEGQFRYWDSKGCLMQIEVPFDQYTQAIELMSERIKNGDIPSIDNIDFAKKIIAKGFFSYDQVFHLAVNGNIDLIKYNEVEETISAKQNISISLAVAYVISRWYGTDKEKALLNTAYLGLKADGFNFVKDLLSAEIRQLGLSTNLFSDSKLAFSLLEDADSVKVLKEILGLSSLSPRGMELRCQIMKKVPSVDYIDIDDVAILFKGRISAAILYDRLKKANEHFGGIPSPLKQFTLTDAEFIIEVAREQFVNLAREYFILPIEARQLVTDLVRDQSGHLARALYQYTDPWTLCNAVLTPLFDDFSKHRCAYTLSLNMMFKALQKVLSDTSDIELIGN